MSNGISTKYLFVVCCTLLQVTVSDEGASMWRVYLDRLDYAMALAACTTGWQRDKVYAAQVRSSQI